MLEKLKNEVKEKKEVLKRAGKITAGIVGAGVLGYFVGRTAGFMNGIDWFWEKGRSICNNDESEQIEDDEEDEEEA